MNSFLTARQHTVGYTVVCSTWHTNKITQRDGVSKLGCWNFETHFYMSYNTINKLG